MSKASEVLFAPLFKDNPIALQVLGICSAFSSLRASFIPL